MTHAISRIRDALRHIDSNDREEWVLMAFAIKNELGDAGFDLWDQWSRQSPSYEARAARATWKSAKSQGGVTIGTLFYLAMKNGWRDSGIHRTPGREEWEERQRIAQQQAAKDAEQAARERAETAEKAERLWAAATDPLNNPYLQLKGIAATPSLRQISASQAARILGYLPKSRGEPLCGYLLVVPVRQEGRLSTIELIDGKKRKASLAGRGSKTGGYWQTGELPTGDGTGLTILIGEGVATVLSVHEATGYPGVAALSCTNLGPVARTIGKHYPKADLVVLADLVRTTGEPEIHAVTAAASVRARLAIPDFGKARDDESKDFNDLVRTHGPDAVRHAIEKARIPECASAEKRSESLQDDGKPRVNLICASDLKPEPITWLWDGWLACGKMHLLAGTPGTGKTTIALTLAATITKGGKWPDSTDSMVGNVVIWSGEDDPKDTLLPRLAAAGADLQRVFFIDSVSDGSDQRGFDPARDMDMLRRRLAEIGEVRLLIVDPIVSVISNDSHKNAEVRRGLQPLSDLAASMRCAVLGITHFSKGTVGRDPVERLNGSIAFGAVARLVWIAAKEQVEDAATSAMRLLVRAKSNIGPDGGGFRYELGELELSAGTNVKASQVTWGDPVEGAARELLAFAEQGKQDSGGDALTEARLFLAEMLSEGPVPANTALEYARAAGHSAATIRRACAALGVVKKKISMAGGWHWSLPRRCSDDDEDAQAESMSTFRSFEHLRDKDSA